MLLKFVDVEYYNVLYRPTITDTLREDVCELMLEGNLLSINGSNKDLEQGFI